MDRDQLWGSQMFTRYAIYFTPDGPLADAGAAWLGWDIASGTTVAHPDVADLDLPTLTARPRKYGFHGTVKAPFALAEGCDEPGLRAAFARLCAGLHPITLDRLEVSTLGRFLALVPQGNQNALRDLAAQVVRDLDPFRGPVHPEELARRRKANLSERQEALLMQWGYPHVMDQFRFHMTLTGPVPRRALTETREHAAAYFAPLLPAPFKVDALALVGQGPDGHFSTLARHSLGAVD